MKGKRGLKNPNPRDPRMVQLWNSLVKRVSDAFLVLKKFLVFAFPNGKSTPLVLK